MSIRPPCLLPLVALALLSLHGCSADPTAPTASAEPGVQHSPLAPATGPVTLVRDINPTPATRQLSSAWGFTRMGAYVYFTASGSGVGNELWRTDGTPEGTTLVRDIIPGPWSSEPSHLTVWRGRLYFLVDLPWGGIMLYSSDGTSAGTLPHTAIIPEGALTVQWVDSVFPTRDALCFSLLADSDPYTDELLCAKETPQELVRIPGPWEEVRGGGGLGYPVFNVVDGVAYFDLKPSGSEQRQGWRTDGTPEGTSRSFLEQLPGLERATRLKPFKGALYFRGGDTAQNLSSLWRTDGTLEGTVRVKQLAGTDSCTCILDLLGDTLWMPSYTPETGTELWKSDGTAEGTVLVKDLVPGTGSSNPWGFARLNATTTLFWGNSPQGFGLWRTDGTADGTVFVATAPSPWMSLVVDGVYYFQKAGPAVVQELWRTDGTAEGTFLVKSLSLGENVEQSYYQTYMAEVDGTLLFRGHDLQDRFGPWRSDGTAEGTVPLVDEPITGGSSPRTSTPVGSRLYFYAAGAPQQLGVWTSDGTSDGTVLLHSGPASSNRPGFVGEEGRTYFSARTPEAGQELWVTDGTPGGTRLVRDLASGTRHAWPQPLTLIGGTLYFNVNLDPERGPELWRTDGTSEGTRPVQELLPAGVSATYSWVLAVGDTLYFRARSDELGGELWRTDGTTQGTRLVRDLAPGPDSSEATPLAMVGDTLYVSAGGKLWKSDGTPEGTVFLKDVGETPVRTVVVDSTLFFLIGTFTSDGHPAWGRLWKTDGTPEGTVRLRSASNVEQLTAMGGALYFFEEEPVGSYALWRTDGTEAGTWRVKPLPRHWWTQGSLPSEMLAVEPEGRLVFAATDESGVEPWVSDGTPEGTRPLQDLYPGPVGSIPNGFTRLGSHVYFAANSPTIGMELWKVPVSALTEPDTGTPDAGTNDAGTEHDAGTADAGTADAGTATDAGTTDAGPGEQPPGESDSGCGCGAASTGAPWLALVLGAWLMRKRRTSLPA